jgi:dihydrofolate reductase
MVSTHVFIAVSLDGYIARQDGDIDWLLQHDDPTDQEVRFVLQLFGNPNNPGKPMT